MSKDDYIDAHREDHDRILRQLDCREMVIGIEKDLLLMAERVKELKDDKERSSRTLMWVVGAALSIIMTVAGSLIGYSADVKVLQEKVAEQKSEIEKTMVFINGLSDSVVNHDHKN